MATIRLNGIDYVLDWNPETGEPRFLEDRAQTVRPSPGTEGGNTLLDSDPLDKYVIGHVPSTRGGFGASLFSQRAAARYVASNGAHMLDTGRFGPTNKLYHVGFGISDPGAEEASSPWTNTNATNTATLSVANSYEGEYHWAFASTSNDGTSYRTLANPTVLRSAAITFNGMGRMSATAAGEAGRLFIWDDVTGFTYSSAVSGTTNTAMTVTATINAAAVTVRVGIADNGTLFGGSRVFRADALGIASAGTDTPVGFAVVGTDLYTAAGRFTYQWDETNDKFDVVNVVAANATAITEFNGNVFVFYGATAYRYGTGTTWTTSSRAGNNALGSYAVRTMNRSGDPVLLRAVVPNTVLIDTSAINGAAAGTSLSVGESDADITNVYAWNRTYVVGKEDGLYVYQGASFMNVTAEKTVAPSADNFALGHEYQGGLWLSGAQGTIWRYGVGQLLGPLSMFQMEGYEYGPEGRVGAFGTDGVAMLVGLRRRSSTTTSWVLATNDGRTVHTLFDFVAPDATDWAATAVDTHFEEIQDIRAMGAFSNYFYVAGTTANGVTRIELARWATPTTSESPYRDTAPDPQPRFYVHYPRMDGGFPNDTKSFTDITLNSRNLAAGSRTVQGYYRVDNGAWTTLASAFNTSPSQTITFASVNGKELEVMLEGISTTGATSPIEVSSVTVAGTLRPTRKRIYQVYVRIGTDIGSDDGVAPIDTAKNQYANLRTAETAANTVALRWVEDFDIEHDTDAVSVNVHVRNVRLEKMSPNSEGGWTRIYEVLCVEA